MSIIINTFTIEIIGVTGERNISIPASQHYMRLHSELYDVYDVYNAHNSVYYF
jgi:hypothetical protein